MLRDAAAAHVSRSGEDGFFDRGGLTVHEVLPLSQAAAAELPPSSPRRRPQPESSQANRSEVLRTPRRDSYRVTPAGDPFF